MAMTTSDRTATLAHFSRGRIRLRARWLARQQQLLPVIRDRFEDHAAIDRVEINQRTGSVLLLYTPAEMEHGHAVDGLLSRLTTTFSPLCVGRVELWSAGNNRMSLAVKQPLSADLHGKIHSGLHRIRGVSDVQTDTNRRQFHICYDDSILAQHIQVLHSRLPLQNWRSLLPLFF